MSTAGTGELTRPDAPLDVLGACYFCTAPGVIRCALPLGNTREACGRPLCWEHAKCESAGLVCRHPSEVS